jgi:hypothetical protein
MTCDTGAILMQLQKNSVPCNVSCFDDAQDAASQADAILDSLLMPCLPSSAVIVDASSSSEGSGDDESDMEQGEKSKIAFPCVGMETIAA